MIPFRSKSVTLSMLIDLLTSRCRSTQVKLYTGLIASTDLWPQEMFTFSEMLALVQSESSFGAYVCHRRPAGLHSDQRSCYVLSSSCHLVTPLIYIHFCVWLGLFVDRWKLKEVWYAPDFLSNCSTRVSLAAPGITKSLRKRICRGTLSQKTRNWPTCKPVHVHERSRERRRSFDPAYSVDNLTQ